MTTPQSSVPLHPAPPIPVRDVRTSAADLAHYGRDWTHGFAPAPSAIALPESVEEVQALVRWANETRTALVPSGGRTGLSGGAVAARGEVVVSMERMRAILSFDAADRSLTVQAGVTTHAAQESAAAHGLYYPVDFASRGSAQIGGNIATNAGGIKVLRYGMTRQWVSGLKVVSGAGDLLEFNRGLVKNATGYDFRHLFIGSEGTLGIVVEATLQLTDPPPAQNVMVLGLPALDSVMAVFDLLRRRLRLSAFEFFTDRALHHVLAAGAQRPFESSTPYYVLAEFDENEDAALAAFEELSEAGWLADGVMSTTPAQAQSLWRLRESITESLSAYKPYKNDIAVRVSDVPAFLRQADALFAARYPGFDVIWFGHIGDGNLHISVLRPHSMGDAEFIATCGQATAQLGSLLAQMGGSVSAEHGIGLLKKPYLDRTRAPAEIQLMRQIKRVFDPNGIMNPGKIFD
ncbi:MAG: FAD-binding oxidoreductase [Proteobacteria bacterium]|nr:FAD-binding oxidoreductase [Pseudomonadota bacterium]